VDPVAEGADTPAAEGEGTPAADGEGTLAADGEGTLVVRMRKFRNDDGQALVALYDSADGYPTKPGKASASTIAAISKKKAVARFPSLKPGEYAVAVIHDEDKNGKLDTNWIGIPKEGLGASNNAKGRMGPPKFEDAKLEVQPSTLIISIDIQYL
jgi:uncharacterized protein (DUF2141 family)